MAPGKGLLHPDPAAHVDASSSIWNGPFGATMVAPPVPCWRNPAHVEMTGRGDVVLSQLRPENPIGGMGGGRVPSELIHTISWLAGRSGRTAYKSPPATREGTCGAT